MMPLAPFTSAASAAASLASAAYGSLRGSEEEAKGLREVSQAAERAQGLAIHLADRLSTARTDLDSALSPSSVVRGIREVGYRASSVLQRLRSSTVELLSMEDGPTESAEVLGLSRQLWECWHSKHMALTAAERLYLTLLSESRRTAALMAELAAVQRLLQEEPTTELSRQKAVESCSAQIQAQALEAVKAFEGRARDYPCGCPHTRTGLLRISRREEDLSSVREAFQALVCAEEAELLAQAKELLVAPDLRTLTSTLARRQVFWEEQIEENWQQWSHQSGLFHEAQAGAADCWAQLRCAWTLALPMRAKAQHLLEVTAGDQTEQGPALHKVLVEVAATLALLGAWAHFHNLRGDGSVLSEVQALFQSLLECLNTRFEKYQGTAAVREMLRAREAWQLVEAPSHRPDDWWHPDNWPRWNEQAEGPS
ncbi:unnamed protein product [Effrenium voratum]|uniref:Uncharacterized protein n=1 Tax=Effrenium voratum TaxID=2562239 RepID=A0AA36HP49_9DINO|nr:unnamed protein product [Effrenium voratum]